MEIDPIQYQTDVLSGKQVAGKYLKLAVKRHISDLKSKSGEFYFDPEAGLLVIKFFSLLNHYKGKFKGKRFELLPWQQWMIYVIYGWKRTADASRRFRRVYIEVSKKNGKTAIGAGLCLYHLIYPGESFSEVYIAATVREQANLAFTDCKEMAKNSPTVLKRLAVYNNSITLKKDNSSIKTLSRDKDTFEGKNPSFGLIDEYHLHKDDLAVENLESAMGSRDQPMMFIITTAGFNKSLPCYKQRKVSIDILENRIKEESTFTIIFSMDKNDDWEDSANWPKANPSMPFTPSFDFLKDQFNKAKNNSTKLISFKTKNLNMWEDAERSFIESKFWDKQIITKEELARMGIDEEELKLIPCYGGLDLAVIRDLNSLALTWYFPEINKYYLRNWYWLPTENMADRVKNDSVRYDIWAEEGYITLTEGNAVDYEFIIRDILNLCEQFNIHSIAYDRYNANQIVHGVQSSRGKEFMYAHGQGYLSMSNPTKTFEADIITGKLLHEGNPVTEWMLRNTVISMDPAGNIKPNKDKSSEKIDGIVAAIMSRSMIIHSQVEELNDGPSQYDKSEQGLWTM